MKERIELAVLGGDERQIAMARTLAEYGYGVRVWGLGHCEERIGDAMSCEAWQTAIEGADAVVLPLPASADGVRVHCPLQAGDVFLRVTTLLDAMSDGLLLGGRLTDAIRSIAEQKRINVIDYFDSEVLQLKNALPTAEGALAIAMKELPVTLDGVKAAVIGYGRIGSLLSEKLHALGADVTVYARRREQLALARLHHHKTKALCCHDGRTAIDLEGCQFRVIFNTVPQWILTREVLTHLPKNCVLIDLASVPGGIDHGAAREMGLCSVWGTSLPGKCAPESAGIILAETVSELLSDLGFGRKGI